MQTSTIISIFFAAFILDIFRSMNSSTENNETQYKKSQYQNYKERKRNYNENYKNFENKNFENKILKNENEEQSMKIKDEKGEDIKISYNKQNKRKNNLIYITIQFCQS